MWVATGEKGQSLGEPQTGAGLLVDEAEAVTAICKDAGIMQPKDMNHVGLTITARWMQCPNKNCQQLLVQVHRKVYDPRAKPGRSVVFGHVDSLLEEETLAFPKRQLARPIDSLIPDAFAVPFREACLIRDDSPGMSAVLSRKVLADLLEQYAGCTGYTVKDQIDKFIANTQHPSHVKENLHYLREMADFAAHTKKDLTTGEILKTTMEEASWTLDVVESLFEYFIVGPAKDATRRAEMTKKMQQAGRKPIPPLQGGNP